MQVLICIPTIEGREAYFSRCIEGYLERTPETNGSMIFSHTTNAPTCGVGWQRAIDAVEPELLAKVDYIHFSNDDIVVGEGWLAPLVEAVERGYVPAPRIEPAGFHLGEEPARSMAPLTAAPSDKSYFYADLPENQPVEDWQEVGHGALPFCSVEQWRRIGSFIPTHFGTDKWFFHRAKQEGFPAVARFGSVIFNYAAQIGREKGEWAETDLIDFDCVFAYPDYVEGKRPPTEPHPLRLTDEGLRMVRRWRAASFPGPHHWETP